MSIYGFLLGQRALWYTTDKGPPVGPPPLHVVIIKQETVKNAFPNPFLDDHHYRVRLEDGTEKVVFYRAMFPDYDYDLKVASSQAALGARLQSELTEGSTPSDASIQGDQNVRSRSQS